MKMYCIVARESLKKMNGNRGKLAAQAGHAYLHAYWDAETRFDTEYHPTEEIDSGYAYHRVKLRDAAHVTYRASRAAKKVCLVVETVDELVALRDRYSPVCGVSLVTDAGLTCFDGPTTTCLGIGPIADDQVGDDLKALKVLI